MTSIPETSHQMGDWSAHPNPKALQRERRECLRCGGREDRRDNGNRAWDLKLERVCGAKPQGAARLEVDLRFEKPHGRDQMLMGTGFFPKTTPVTWFMSPAGWGSEPRLMFAVCGDPEPVTAARYGEEPKRKRTTRDEAA